PRRRPSTTPAPPPLCALSLRGALPIFRLAFFGPLTARNLDRAGRVRESRHGQLGFDVDHFGQFAVGHVDLASFVRLGFRVERTRDRKSTGLNSSHVKTSYAVFCSKTKSTSTPKPGRTMTPSLSSSSRRASRGDQGPSSTRPWRSPRSTSAMAPWSRLGSS